MIVDDPDAERGRDRAEVQNPLNKLFNPVVRNMWTNIKQIKLVRCRQNIAVKMKNDLQIITVTRNVLEAKEIGMASVSE